MLIHIYGGIYIVDSEEQRTPLQKWHGELLCLDTVNCPAGTLHLRIADQVDLEPADLHRGTQLIHAQREQGQKITLYCADNTGKAMTLVVAYLIEYLEMTLEDAYMLTANRFYSVSLPRGWMMTLIEEYKLPYTMKDVYDSFFFSQLMATSNLNIHHIEHGVYISNIDAMRKPDKVRALGITAVVRVDDSERSMGNWAADFTLLDMPLIDGSTLHRADVKRAAAFIHQQVEAGNKVLVHCHAGVSRSVTMVLAYLIEYCGMSLSDALALVVRKRPVAFPHPALVQSLVMHYKLPHDLNAVLRQGFVDNLLAEGEYQKGKP